MPHKAARGRAAQAIGLALLFQAGVVAAADRGPLQQRVYLNLGGFFPDTDTIIRMDGASGRGTEVNFGEEFGFRDQSCFRIDGSVRIAKRHKARVLYFRNALSAERTIDRRIDFGDVSYPIDVAVRAEFKTEIIEAAYEYAFVRRDRFELTGTLGVHLIRFSAALTGEGAPPRGSGVQVVREEASADGPLPVLGVRAVWDLGANWFVDAQAQFLALSVDGYDGRLEDYRVALTWQPLQRLGMGVAYNEFTSRLDADVQRFGGRLSFEYGGPLLFVALAF